MAGTERRLTAAAVSRAVAAARAYVGERDVPLTVERLAAELHMDAADFCRLARGKGTETWRATLRDAYEEANASVVEYAMKKGSGANMHMLYLKQYGGYREGPEEPREPVIFYGEDKL